MDISTFGYFAFWSFLDTSTVVTAIKIDKGLRIGNLIIMKMMMMMMIMMMMMMDTAVESDNWKPDGRNTISV